MAMEETDTHPRQSGPSPTTLKATKKSPGINAMSTQGETFRPLGGDQSLNGDSSKSRPVPGT
jgi:hypothetical protein